jgi:phosphoribosylglycinamide formyltransferase-1
LSIVNLLADLGDPRFDAMRVHEALEKLDERGVHVQRYMRTPERYLSWIDAEFGGWWSSRAFEGSSYIAEDAAGPVGFATFDSHGDIGVFGPFGVASRARKSGLGPALLHGALFSLRERGFAQARIPHVESEKLIAYFQRHANARVGEDARRVSPDRRYRTVVLASGNGTNFQAVIDAVQARRLPLDLVCLVVNRADAYSIERANAASIPVKKLLWDKAAITRAQFDATVDEAVAAAKPDLVLLLGWMHVLDRSFLERFPQILNIHPAFLPLDMTLDEVTMPDGKKVPAFRGARAFDDALAQGVAWFGVSVHRLGSEIDRGAIMVRAPLSRANLETRDELLERVHAIERRILTQAVERWIYERHDDR